MSCKLWRELILDVSLHLYKKVSLPVGPSICQLVHWSVQLLVHWSVHLYLRNAFLIFLTASLENITLPLYSHHCCHHHHWRHHHCMVGRMTMKLLHWILSHFLLCLGIRLHCSFACSTMLASLTCSAMPMFLLTRSLLLWRSWEWDLKK